MENGIEFLMRAHSYAFVNMHTTYIGKGLYSISKIKVIHNQALTQEQLAIHQRTVLHSQNVVFRDRYHSIFCTNIGEGKLSIGHLPT